MRIGTWNLAGRWDPRHERLLRRQNCDVWLLTEVHQHVELNGYSAHTTAGWMRPHVAWASVLCRGPMRVLLDPHPATAAAEAHGVTFCSSILPWRSCGGAPPWSGENHAHRTEAAVRQLMAALPPGPIIWGGDWNHALSGREFAGSVAGRNSILEALHARELTVTTRDLPHAIDGLLSIDHIALPRSLAAVAQRIPAVMDGARLSDHDVYVAECRGSLSHLGGLSIAFSVSAG